MKHRFWPVLALCLMAGGQLAAHSANASEGVFKPHRGLYRVTLETAESSSGIIGASGKTYFEWMDKCAGWNVNQHSNLTLTTSQDTTDQIDLTFSGWEAKDGTVMRFQSSQIKNGAMAEHIVGEANLPGTGGAGLVSYTKPGKFTVALPEGTLFPSEYSRRMMLRIRAGKSSHTAIMFDGSSTKGAYEVSSIFSEPRMHARPGASPASMKKENVWPVRMAYFPLRGGDAEPDFEVGALISAQGVAHRYDIDYGTFVVRAVLVQYEEIPLPNC